MHTPWTDGSTSPQTEWFARGNGVQNAANEAMEADGCECLEGDADLHNFADLKLGESDSDSRGRAIFSGSGNHFVFDDVLDEERAQNNSTPREVVSVVVPAPPPPPQPQPQPQPSHALQAPPQALPAGDVATFIDSFKREGRGLPSAIVTLQTMMHNFPHLVYLARNAVGTIEVHFLRDALIKTLRDQEQKFPNIVFTSFERGLKHAGMEVTQSTHGQILIKKWAKKRGFVPKPSAVVSTPSTATGFGAAGAGSFRATAAPKQRRSRKRKEQSDDDFVDGDKYKKVRPGAAPLAAPAAAATAAAAQSPATPALPQLHMSSSTQFLFSLLPVVPPPPLPRLSFSGGGRDCGMDRTSSE